MSTVQVTTLADIITRFELQVNDLTELSTAEETALANEIYQDVCNDRPWQFLRRPSTGALLYDSVAGMWYAPVPADFNYLLENNMYTDNTLGIDNNAAPKGIFVGKNYAFYQLVNYGDRIQYRTANNVCYYDPNQNKIYIPIAPGDTSLYQFDYSCIAPDLVNMTDVPLFPVRFRKVIPFGMAIDNDILQRFPATSSLAPENTTKYEDTLADMELWDADLALNN